MSGANFMAAYDLAIAAAYDAAVAAFDVAAANYEADPSVSNFEALEAARVNYEAASAALENARAAK